MRYLHVADKKPHRVASVRSRPRPFRAPWPSALPAAEIDPQAGSLILAAKYGDFQQWHEQRGTAPGTDDRAIAPAPRQIHEHPQRQWTIGALSEVAGLPRTAFTRRFTTLVGQPQVRCRAEPVPQYSARNAHGRGLREPPNDALDHHAPRNDCADRRRPRGRIPAAVTQRQHPSHVRVPAAHAAHARPCTRASAAPAPGAARLMLPDESSPRPARKPGAGRP